MFSQGYLACTSGENEKLEKEQKNKKRENDTHETNLQKELRDLERKLTIHNVNRYNDLKGELDKIAENKAKGSIIRSKCLWYEKGEKSTAYFFGLERNRAINKHVRKLKLENGEIVTDPTKILREQSHFYSQLYSSDAKDSSRINDYNNVFKLLNKLNESEKELCEGTVAIAECETALKSFQNDKSPGNDGITAEFYKYFWNQLKIPLVECFNYSHTKYELSSSQKQAVITLIHIKDKDRLYIENWRPISLLNRLQNSLQNSNPQTTFSNSQTS